MGGREGLLASLNPWIPFYGDNPEIKAAAVVNLKPLDVRHRRSPVSDRKSDNTDNKLSRRMADLFDRH